jgi:hypothetical protein
VIVTLSACTVGSCTYTLGGVSGSSLVAATTYTDYITATTTGDLTFTPSATGARFTISAVSIKALATSWLKWKPYNYIFLADHSTDVTTPSCFTIRDASPLALVTGTTTSSGSISTGGESTVTATAAHFNTTSAAVNSGDFISNTTTLATGIITAVTSDTVLQTAMFNDTTGEPEGWNSGDTFTISRQGRFSVMVDPSTDDAFGAIRIPYIARPAPVYSYFRTYPFPIHFKDALISYAAWKYKYRNQEPNFGDGYYKIWDLAVQQLAQNMNVALNRKGFKTNFIRPTQRTGAGLT